jgi:hypothetical protein
MLLIFLYLYGDMIFEADFFLSVHVTFLKTDRIRTGTTDTDTDSFSFSDRIRIQTVYFLSNSDIHHIWIIEIQL